jgi:hypothetical protein
MTQEEIKQDVETHYLAIKTAEERIKELRILCHHPNTKDGLYSYRVGRIDKALICADCGEVIKLLEPLSLSSLAIQRPIMFDYPDDGITPTENDLIIGG